MGKIERGELTRPSRTCNHSFPCGVSNQNLLIANLRQVVLGREETEAEAKLGARKALLVLPLTYMKLPLPPPSTLELRVRNLVRVNCSHYAQRWLLVLGAATVRPYPWRHGSHFRC